MIASMKATVLLCVIGLPIGAQAPVRDTSWRDSPDRSALCSPGLELQRRHLHSLSQHAGWGMFLGGIAGTAYGVAHARGPLRGLVIVWDGLAAGTAGMVIGSAVYAVRRARGYSPPHRPSCNVPPNEAFTRSAHGESAGWAPLARRILY